MVSNRAWVRQRQAQESDLEQLLWANEVARILGVGRNRAYELMSSGEIPSVRIGRSIRVRRQALEAWIEEQERVSKADVA